MEVSNKKFLKEFSKNQPLILGNFGVFFMGMSRITMYLWDKGGCFPWIKPPLLFKICCCEMHKNILRFYALWLILNTTVEKCWRELQVYEDSKISMNWVNDKCRIKGMLLGPTMNQILELKNRFAEFSFMYIYGFFNSKVEKLSREAILRRKDSFLSESSY